MQLASELLYLVAMCHMIAIVLILIYFATKLWHVQDGSITPQEYCFLVGPLVPVKLALHGLPTFMLYLHGSRLIVVLNMPMIAWELFKLVWNWKDGEYNVEKLEIAGNVTKKKWYHTFAILYFVVMASLYLKRMDQRARYFHTILYFFQLEAVPFLVIMVLIYAMICILVVFIQKTAELEFNLLVMSQDDDGLTNGKLSRFLARTLNKKLLLHSIISGVLLVYQYYVLFGISILMIIWEILQISWVAKGTENILDPQQFSTGARTAKMHLAFFIVFLYLATLLMLKDRKEAFTITNVINRYRFAGYAHIGLTVVPFGCLIICYAFYLWENLLSYRARYIILNALFSIQSVLHTHLLVYLIVSGHWIVLGLNCLYIIFEIMALDVESDRSIGFLNFNDIRRRKSYKEFAEASMTLIVYFVLICFCCLYVAHYSTISDFKSLNNSIQRELSFIKFAITDFLNMRHW